ncbi:MAG: alanine racemase [Acidobacteria bacterium]|nr:alanine racemase [Acidobacteriota bacterium]
MPTSPDRPAPDPPPAPDSVAVRPTFARVDLDAVRANYAAVARHVNGPRAPLVIAVVKANAYGHGAVPVARALEQAGAAMLACADIEEAVTLRDGGITAPILVFGALGISDLDGVFTHGLTPTVSSPFAARALSDAAARRGATVTCHLKIDTGMNRLGFRFDNLGHTIRDVLGRPGLEIAAAYTHFATADEPAHPLFDLQRKRFDESLRRLAGMGIRPGLRHAANSAALLRDRSTWYDAVRPGLLLYGLVPPGLEATVPVAPAMTMRSQVVAVKGMRAGETTGYGARAPVDRPATIAVVPAGYADGLDVRMAGRCSVLVRGRRVPVVGAVSMDSITIDVTGLDVTPGDEVVLVGEQSRRRIGAGEIAAALGTVPHEVLCRTGSRIVRTYAGRASPR